MNKTALLPAKFAKLEVETTSIPTPRAHEVLVNISSAAFNPVDYKIQTAGRFFDTFPRVLGGDVAGTVEAVGPDVTRFKKGDRVFTFLAIFGEKEPGTRCGGFQQYTVATDVVTGIVPANVSMDTAATIPLAFCTAADGLYNFLKLDKPSKNAKVKQGPPVLVWGGASSVGQFAIQLLKNAGYQVITTASKSGHAALQALGADVVLDYHDSDIVEQVQKAADGKLTMIYDSISTETTIPQVIACLPNGGQIAFTQLTPETAKVDCPENVKWTRVYAGTLQTVHKELGVELFDWASEALADGRLKGNPVKLQAGGLNVVQATLDLYKKEGIQGAKFVIRPHES